MRRVDLRFFTTEERKTREGLRFMFLSMAVWLILGMTAVSFVKPCIVHRGPIAPAVPVATASSYEPMNQAVAQAEIAMSKICLCHPDLGRQLRAMPFLEQVTFSDVQALNGIGRLVDHNFGEILFESEIWKGGIKDEHTAVIAAASMPEKPRIVEEFLNLESHEAGQTPSGTTVRIFRRKPPEGPGPSAEMKYALESVGMLEKIMGMSLPTDEIVISQDRWLDGYHYPHTAISIGTYTPIGEKRETWSRYLIAHEMAHYWWLNNRRWVNEGLATTLGNMALERAGIKDDPQGTTFIPCRLKNIKQLEEQGKTKKGQKNFLCNYELGYLLFNDLRESMDEGEFTGSLQKLLRLSQDLHKEGKKAGIKEVRLAFPGHQEIIDRRYHGAPGAG